MIGIAEAMGEGMPFLYDFSANVIYVLDLCAKIGKNNIVMLEYVLLIKDI